MRIFLKATWPDFLLCLVASAALVYTVSYGFESVPSVRGNVAVCVLLCAPMLALLFAGGYSRRLRLASVAAACVWAVAAVGAASALLPAGVPLFADGALNDVAESPVPFALVAVAVPAAVYALSRRRASCLALFFFAALACCAVQFLFRDFVSLQPGTLASFTALGACGALVVYQGYRTAVLGADRTGSPAFARAGLFAVGISTACLLAGALVFWAVIDPLGLSTANLKPFKDYYQRPVVEFTGVYTPQTVEDPDELTDLLNDQEEESNQDSEGGDEGRESEQDAFGGNPLAALLNMVSSFDITSWLQQFRAISYETLQLTALVALLLAAAGMAAAIALRRRWRARRLARLEGQTEAYRVWWLYEFLLSRLRKLGVERPASATPLEFAMAARAETAPYFAGSETDLLGLTLAYQRAAFAPQTLKPEDDERLRAAYDAFYRNARRLLGRRWATWFWRL